MDVNVLYIITKIVNSIYNSEKIFEEWLYSTFIPILKKHFIKSCGDYRIIAYNIVRINVNDAAIYFVYFDNCLAPKA